MSITLGALLAHGLTMAGGMVVARTVSNAISGITIVGAIIATAGTEGSTTATIIGFVALVLATINVVGGYMVTDRMLAMFKKKGDK